MPQSRRVLFCVLALIVIIGSTAGGLQSAQAQDGGGGRTRTIEVTGTQYVWNLLTAGGQVVCEVLTDTNVPPDAARAAEVCTASILAILPTQVPGNAPQVTATPFSINRFLANAYWRLVETRQVTREVVVELPDLIVYISAPTTTVTRPYVILTAYEPAREFEIVGIDGTVEEETFHCDGTRCEVPLPLDTTLSTIVFWATSSDGSESDHITAEAQLVLVSTGYQVVVSSASYLKTYVDSCAQVWGITTGGLPAWATFPTSPEDLHTYKTLHFLSAELISAGVVDARDCDGGGFISPGAPNACGIERAREAVNAWQNQFDPVIWTSGLTAGIPPRLIKAVIEQESQFWPGNELRYLNEYGLAQLSNWGADVALRWNNSLYQQICSDLLIDCSVSYANLPTSMQAMLRGGLMRAIDADCPSCNYGVDLSAAEQSIPVIAQTLYGNCRQAQFIMDRHEATASYDTLWKFTLVSYHSGFTCLDSAVAAVRSANQEINWENVSAKLDCLGGKDYINNLWLKLASLPDQLRPTPYAPQPTVLPTFVPRFTPTPTTPPEPVTVRVSVFVDTNNNRRLDPGEGVDGVEARVRFTTGQTQTQLVQDGLAVFEFIGPTEGSRVTISLPDLYREIYALVPESLEVAVSFRLEQPPLPTALP